VREETLAAHGLLPRRRALAGLLVAGLTLAACGPEAGRVRGGGPGADIGNRGATVDLHGEVNPAYRVPTVGKGSGT
jgi:hypothetical protein